MKIIEELLEKFKLGTKATPVVLAVACGIIALDLLFVLRPQINQIMKINKRIVTLTKDINKVKLDLASMQELNRKSIQSGKQGALSKKRMISDEEIPGLLKEISDIANKNQIRIMQARPLKQARDQKGKNAQNFSSALINLDVSGDYHNFGAFLSDLENGPVFLTVEDFKISPKGDDIFRQDIKLGLKANVRK